MGIGKGKSDKIDIDGLIGGTDNENEALQRSLTGGTETNDHCIQYRY